MIVPYNMIPVQYFKPLIVETKMEYVINKRKFPGLSIKSERAQPALLVATEPKLLSEHGDNLPMDLSKRILAHSNKEERKRNRKDIVTRTKSKRLQLDQGNKCAISQPDTSKKQTPDVIAKLETVSPPDAVLSAQSHLSLLTPSRLSSSEHPISGQSTPIVTNSANSCLTSVQSTLTSSTSTHPSYLDFIYGANGLLAQMASKNKKSTALKNKSTIIQPVESKRCKRKREDEGVVSIGNDFSEHMTKRLRTDCNTKKEASSSKVHTIHYMPTTSSIICDKSLRREGPAVWLSQSHQFWTVPTADGFNQLIQATSTPTRKLGQRQS